MSRLLVDVVESGAGDDERADGEGGAEDGDEHEGQAAEAGAAAPADAVHRVVGPRRLPPVQSHRFTGRKYGLRSPNTLLVRRVRPNERQARSGFVVVASGVEWL